MTSRNCLSLFCIQIYVYIYRLGKKMGDDRAKTSIYEYKLIYFWVIYIHSARKQISVILNYFTFNLEFYIYL